MLLDGPKQSWSWIVFLFIFYAFIESLVLLSLSSLFPDMSNWFDRVRGVRIAPPVPDPAGGAAVDHLAMAIPAERGQLAAADDPVARGIGHAGHAGHAGQYSRSRCQKWWSNRWQQMECCSFMSMRLCHRRQQFEREMFFGHVDIYTPLHTNVRAHKHTPTRTLINTNT